MLCSDFVENSFYPFLSPRSFQLPVHTRMTDIAQDEEVILKIIRLSPVPVMDMEIPGGTTYRTTLLIPFKDLLAQDLPGLQVVLVTGSDLLGKQGTGDYFVPYCVGTVNTESIAGISPRIPFAERPTGPFEILQGKLDTPPNHFHRHLLVCGTQEKG